MKTRSLVNAAIMLAIYMVFFVLYYIGILPTIMSILLPIPLIIYSVMTEKVSDMIWLLVGCFIGTGLLGSVYGLVATLNYGVMGAIIGIGMLKKWPYWQRLLNASIISVIAYPLMIYVLSGIGLQESMTQMIQEVFAQVQSMGVLPEESLTMLTTMEQSMLTMFTTLLPTLLLLIGLLNAFVTDKISMFILKRMNYKLPTSGNIQKFQLGATLATVYIGSQFLSLFVSNHIINVILMNIIMLLNTLFLVQGLVVAMTYFKSRNQKGFGIFMILLALMSSLSMYISILGVTDAWFDYRERFAVKRS